MARVSIGLPVYNGAKYVRAAVESVLSQTYDDWELIISDNASVDATEAICRSLADRDNRIRFIRSEQNRGAAWNFNRVFHLSNGEYFRWLSHDDALAPSALEQCVEVLENRPEVVLCCTQTSVIDSDGYRLCDEVHPSSDLAFQGLKPSHESARRRLATSPKPSERYRGILLYSLRCYEVYGLIRRSVMLSSQLHPSYCGGEKVLLAELALRGPFVELEDKLFYCRWHDERFSSNNSARQQIEHMDPARRIRFPLPHQYRATLGYLQLIASPDLSIGDRLGCLATWIRFTFQIRKWASIARNTVTGGATIAQQACPTRRGERLLPLNSGCCDSQDRACV